MSEQQQRGKIVNSSAVFFVTNRKRTLDYYAKLGFHCEYDFGFVQRDGIELIVHESEKPKEIRPNYPLHREDALDIFCMVEGIDSLFEQFKQNGASLRYELRVTSYNMKEFAIVDPDGYSIGFGESLV